MQPASPEQLEPPQEPEKLELKPEKSETIETTLGSFIGQITARLEEINKATKAALESVDEAEEEVLSGPEILELENLQNIKQTLDQINNDAQKDLQQKWFEVHALIGADFGIDDPLYKTAEAAYKKTFAEAPVSAEVPPISGETP